MIHDEFTDRKDLSYWQKWSRRHPEQAAYVSQHRDRSRTLAQKKAHREQERKRKRAYRKLHPLPHCPHEKKQNLALAATAR